MVKFGSNLSAVIEELQAADAVQTAKDVELQNQMDSEVALRINANAQLKSDINTEVNSRLIADKDLQEQIGKEVLVRGEGDKALQTNLDAEVAARADADKQLQVNINVEADTRKTADEGLQEQIDALSIAGMVQYFARQTAPKGWMKADGAAVSRAKYVNLFAAIGTVFGAGDGSSTFNLPDLRGQFIRGFDDGCGVDAGRKFGSLQADELKGHNHLCATYNGVSGPYETAYTTGGYDYGNQAPPTTSTGGSETRPRNVALLACIKY